MSSTVFTFFHLLDKTSNRININNANQSLDHISEAIHMRSLPYRPGSKELRLLIQYAREHQYKTPHIEIHNATDAVLQKSKDETDIIQYVYVGTGGGLYQYNPYTFHLKDGTSVYNEVIPNNQTTFRELPKTVGLHRSQTPHYIPITNHSHHE
jgi:hypothetical protein